jgi:hypothetical protein
MPAMTGRLVTRPLKTGQKFRLVVPQLRVFLLRWDKARYAHAAEAELSVEGRELGSEPLELRVEEQADRGSWGSAATLRAKVNGDGTRAACTWKFPDGTAERFRFKVRSSDGRELTSGTATAART